MIMVAYVKILITKGEYYILNEVINSKEYLNNVNESIKKIYKIFT